MAKGHKILNTVDCTRPNGGRLPEKVALMMSDFAGGASGFPMTFSGGKFTEEWKAQFIKTERRKLLNYKAQLVKDLQPRVFCPFAGYFVEAHPADKYADARRCLPCELARRNRGVAVVQWGGRGLDEASRTLHQVAGNRGWEQPLGSQRQCRDCFKASQGRGRQSVFIKYWVVRKVRMRFSLCKKCVTTFLTTQSMAGRSPASSP